MAASNRQHNSSSNRLVTCATCGGCYMFSPAVHPQKVRDAKSPAAQDVNSKIYGYYDSVCVNLLQMRQTLGVDGRHFQPISLERYKQALGDAARFADWLTDYQKTAQDMEQNMQRK